MDGDKDDDCMGSYPNPLMFIGFDEQLRTG